MATKHNLYNEALRIVGETRLASITETRPIRYDLDDVWDGGGVEACLDRGLWNFATVGAAITYDPDVTPDFGFRYAFSKPTDYVKTAAICTDEFFSNPLLQYSDEQEYWFAEIDTLYIKYVSKDESYGLNLSKWPPNFATYVAAYFAYQVAPKYVKDKRKLAAMREEREATMKIARSSDAMNQPTVLPAPGNWSRSRYSNSSSGTHDRGSNSRLIG